MEKVSTFFQDSNIFHHTLRENVAYGDIRYLANEEKIVQALELGGADKILKGKMPKGLDTLMGKDVDKNGVQLSGGEKQRVTVSRSFMSERDVIILDEPASMIDPVAEFNQFQNISQHFKGRTIILISHRVGFARLADLIFYMENGKN